MSLENATGDVLIGLRLDPFHDTKSGRSHSHEDENARVLSMGLALARRSRRNVRLLTVCEPSSTALTSAAPWLAAIPSKRLRLDMITAAVRREACANQSMLSQKRLVVVVP